jgi:hypothetical protein
MMARKRHKRLQAKHAEKPHEEIQEEAEKPAPRADTKAEETHTRLSVLIYTIGAVIVGFASLQVSPMAGNMLTILFGLVMAWVVGKVVQSMVGQKDIKWLIGNGLFIYIFVWLISWIFFFNLLGQAG